MEIIAKIKARKRISRIERQSVVTAIFFKRHKKVIEHLGECQSDHNEVHSCGAQAEGTYDKGGKGCCKNSQRQNKQSVFTSGKHKREGEDRGCVKTMEIENPGHIGSDTHKSRMTETNHAAVAKKQVKTYSGQGVNQNSTAEREQVGLVRDLSQKGKEKKKECSRADYYVFSC